MTTIWHFDGRGEIVATGIASTAEKWLCLAPVALAAVLFNTDTPLLGLWPLAGLFGYVVRLRQRGSGRFRVAEEGRFWLGPWISSPIGAAVVLRVQRADQDTAERFQILVCAADFDAASYRGLRRYLARRLLAVRR